MSFKNYCIVILGDTLGAIPEIVKISEIEPNTLDGKGMLIATFSSILTPSQISDWFIDRKRNFLIFDLDERSSGVNINKREIHEGLFGFLKTIDIDAMNANFLKDIELSSDTKNTRSSTKQLTESTETKIKKITESDINKMNKEEKQKLLDEFIDNGLENLSEEDKKLLPLLAK